MRFERSERSAAGRLARISTNGTKPTTINRTAVSHIYESRYTRLGVTEKTVSATAFVRPQVSAESYLANLIVNHFGTVLRRPGKRVRPHRDEYYPAERVDSAEHCPA